MHKYLNLDHVLECNGIDISHLCKSCLITTVQPAFPNNWDTADVSTIQRIVLHDRPTQHSHDTCPELAHIIGAKIVQTPQMQLHTHQSCAIAHTQPTRRFVGSLFSKAHTMMISTVARCIISGAEATTWAAFEKHLLSELVKQLDENAQETTGECKRLVRHAAQLSSTAEAIPHGLWSDVYTECWVSPEAWTHVSNFTTTADDNKTVSRQSHRSICCKPTLLSAFMRGLPSALVPYCNDKTPVGWYAIKSTAERVPSCTHNNEELTEFTFHPCVFSTTTVLHHIFDTMQKNPTRCGILASSYKCDNSSIEPVQSCIPSLRTCMRTFACIVQHRVPVLTLQSATCLAAHLCTGHVILINDTLNILSSVLSHGSGHSVDANLMVHREYQSTPPHTQSLAMKLRHILCDDHTVDAICVQMPIDCASQTQFSMIVAIIQITWIMLAVGKQLTLVCSDCDPTQQQFGVAIAIAAILLNVSPEGFSHHTLSCIGIECCGGTQERHFVVILRKRQIAIESDAAPHQLVFRHYPLIQTLLQTHVSAFVGVTRCNSDVEQLLQIARRPPFHMMKQGPHVTRETMWHRTSFELLKSIQNHPCTQ